MRCVQVQARENELIASAQEEYDQAVLEAEAVIVVESGSDEESTNKTKILPDHLTLQPSPSKRKRGGQVKGRGRARAKPMIFDVDDFSGKGHEDLDKLADERFKLTSMNMVEFFKQHATTYLGEFGGILVDLPYANQPSDCAKDPPISDQSAKEIAHGMWKVGQPHLVVVLGCGSIEQVLLLSLFCCC